MRKTMMTLLAAVLITTLGAVAFAEPVPESTPATDEAQQAQTDQSTDLAKPAEEQESVEADVCSAGAAFESPARIIESAGAGELCGGVVCPKFTYCCNPSCSRCVFYGMSCTQESCN
ncbi:MAG: hypothetical protein GY719_03190 [bacterium]|nr:hypothetical protein [bacterium]